MYTVEMSIHGARRINTREFPDLDTARARAKRWSESNSTGHYWAEVKDPAGQILARFNLPRPR